MPRWVRKVFIVVALLGVILLAGLLGTRTGRAALASTEAFVPLPEDGRIRYEAGARQQAEVMARLLPDAIAQIERAQHNPFAGAVKVLVCATQERFNTHVPRGTRARGAAFMGTVFLSPRAFTTKTEDAILVHELSHLHLQQRLGSYQVVRALPAWFQEGLAVYVSGGGGAESVDPATARNAILAGQTFTPEDTGAVLFPQTASDYGLAHHMFYRQSALFVAYLHDRDADAFANFMTALQNGQAFKDAAGQLGGSVQGLWDHFIKHLETVSIVDPNR